jgi:hypothetical protein
MYLVSYMDLTKKKNYYVTLIRFGRFEINELGLWSN